MKKLQAIRGMNDILPDQSPTWQFLEKTFSRVVKRFGYEEIRFPIVEQTQLFKRSIGEVTDERKPGLVYYQSLKCFFR